MPVNVRIHPEFPFAEANLEATLVEIESFVADPLMTGAERTEVLEFVRLTRQFAFLERLIQGKIFFDLPVHMEIFAGEPMPPEAQAEAMAREEREILGLGIEPGTGLAETLDNQGIKVFRRCHGPEPPTIVNGAFYFAGEAGPALLASAFEGCADVVFVLAHEYGHLVMDVNPYVSRFCRWRRGDLENENPSSLEERRADRFARALLVPDDLLKGVKDHRDIERFAESLALPRAVVWRRMGDLGIPRPEAPPPLEPAEVEHEVDESRPTDLPERFVNLALAAYSTRILGKPELTRFLRVPHKRLEQFLQWSRIPRQIGREDEVGGEEESENE